MGGNYLITFQPSSCKADIRYNELNYFIVLQIDDRMFRSQSPYILATISPLRCDVVSTATARGNLGYTALT